MRGDLVALDLESTGLDIETSAIIEIGAVRFRDGVVLDEFKTFVDPECELPVETTFITGIQESDLRGAPSMQRVRPLLERFIGDAPIVAHKADFDIAFLRRKGFNGSNLVLDTLEIAPIILPTLSSYGLSHLALHLGVELGNMHRALDDAYVTANVYHRLWEEALKLPRSLYQAVLRAIRPNFRWSLQRYFEALAESASDDHRPLVHFPEYQAPRSSFQADPTRVTIDWPAFFSEDGPLAQIIPQYQVRPQQVQMAQTVSNAFEQQQHWLIEAGTGSGKTLAYLLPALHFAQQHSTRVVISTYTLPLQSQLLEHDLPQAQQALGVDLAVSLVKGRSNYLCPRRLDIVRHRQHDNPDTIRMLAKILVWLQSSSRGDRSEISLRQGEHNAWPQFSAEDDDCSTNHCEALMRGVCPFYQARKRAEASQILIVNHALLTADALSSVQVLPSYEYLIVDEAHQLEDAATQSLQIRVDEDSVSQRLNEIGGLRTGLLSELLSVLRQYGTDKQVARLEAWTADIQVAIQAVLSQTRRYFQALADALQDLDRDGSGQLRLNGKLRSSAAIGSVTASWSHLDESLATLVESLQGIVQAFEPLKAKIAPLESYLISLAGVAQRLASIHEALRSFSLKPDKNQVCWIGSVGYSDYPTVNIAPLNVGVVMRQALWQSKRSVILTSATLQTHEGFDFVRERLGTDTAHELEIGSPFDYKRSALVYVPRDMPEPMGSTKHSHQKALERAIVDLAAALDGRLLVLFTSYTQLRETAAAIAPRLALGNIGLFEQGGGTSREAMLEEFRMTRRAVLMGARSFWQGIDLPGDELIGLAIVRLPFAVPTDPVFSARAETYADPFHSYAVTDAILRFRQGFGRLIRSAQDRGVVVIFDSRIINKDYGRSFLDALPDCTLQIGPLSQLAHAARQWMAQGSKEG
ncbi:MAG: helicase C-terminal domain-containing protein [Anaerolineae bacterium]|nr:helicase C-terminal domain-containing protein [Anaerolineae bacterium]